MLRAYFQQRSLQYIEEHRAHRKTGEHALLTPAPAGLRASSWTLPWPQLQEMLWFFAACLRVLSAQLILSVWTFGHAPRSGVLATYNSSRTYQRQQRPCWNPLESELLARPISLGSRQIGRPREFLCRSQVCELKH